VGVSKETISQRMKVCQDLDRCPKSDKLSAMFEEAARAKENLIRSGKEYGKGLTNSSKAIDQPRAEQARERQGARNDLNIPQTFAQCRPPPDPMKNKTTYKIGELAGVSHLLHSAGDRGCGGARKKDNR
jgi:hypothetical protein